MLIQDEQILSYIRTHYDGYENYQFDNEPISEERCFTIVKDINLINEDTLTLSKDIFIRGLNFSRQINCINITNICDSLNTEIHDLDKGVYEALEKYNKIYTKSFLKNGSCWVDLYAFNLACDKAKESLNNNNPRTLFNVSKYSHLLNISVLNSANLRLSLVSLQSCLELMHTEIRKMNYDTIMRPVTTISTNDEKETYIQTKYVNNFTLHHDIKFDHEFQVFGTIAGLTARKNKGNFGTIKSYYSQFDLYSVLTKDYGYLNMDVKILDSVDQPILVNGKQIAHKVLLKRKKLVSHFSAFSNLTAKILTKHKMPKEAYVYDYEHPISLNSISTAELDTLISKGEIIAVYQVDETLFDNNSIYDVANPQSSIVIKKGEIFNAPYNLFGIVYKKKTQSNSLWNYVNHFLVFSKTLQSEHIQRIKLFDSVINQQKNSIIRAEQAEESLKELQKSNEKIIELNSSLQDKVKERTKELELLNEQRTFTFINLTHEMKTPLTLINNYLDDFIDKNGETEELRIIKSSTDKLTRDIVNFFDLERFNKGIAIYNHEQICCFSDILKISLALFKSYAAKKNIVISDRIDESIYLKSDPDAIYRIINNLVENAIKYTPINGKIEIILCSQNERIYFTVRDSGVGITEVLREKIFDVYYQIKHEKSNCQGMGIGLSIVKKIIDNLNGSIDVKNNAFSAEGTEITVCLLAHQYFSTEKINSLESNKKIYFPEDILFIAPGFDEQKRTLLLIDDNIPFINYLAKKLCNHYNVELAINGSEALKKIKTKIKIDLIISDVMMDYLDGLTFYKEVLQDKRLSHIPIIFISAKISTEDRLNGLTLGAIDYIQKPFLFEELTCKINSILNTMERQNIAVVTNAYNNLMVINNYERRGVKTSSFKNNPTSFNFTNREIDIIKLIEKGNTYKMIADILFISDKTVAKHIQNIFEKVEVTNKLELLNKLGMASILSN